MADNDSTLILSGKETVSVAVKAAIDSLEKYTVAVGEVTAADKKFLSSGAAVTAQLNGQAAAASKAATAVKSSSTVAISAATKQTGAYQAYTAALNEAAAAQKRLEDLQLSSRAESAVAISPTGVAASTVRPAKTVTGLAAANAIGGTSAISAADAAQADRYAAALNEDVAAQLKLSTSEFELMGVQATLNEQMAAGADLAAGESFSLLALTANSTAARHALEATSRATATLGIGLLAIPILTAVVAKDFQSDFANVSRALVDSATPKQLAAIKDQLLTLSETTPTSFKNLTAIASAGAQMGVSAKDIIAFTKTVAELTITTTISAAAAESFIRKFQLITGVGASQFANLTSALLNVGIHTGATEAQIALLATQIVGIGKVAGLTNAQVIGLAAGFASINSTGPSRARGTIVRAFTDIQTAIQGGTPALTEFAKTAGVTTDQVVAAFGTNKFAGVFESFLQGLDKVQKSGGDAVGILNDLGITSTVDIPLLLNAAGAYKLFGTALADANAGYADAGILALHYNVIQKTVASQLTDLKNTFGVLANSIGTAAIPALTNVAKILEDVGKNLANFSQTAGGGVTLNAFAWIAVVGGSLLLLISIMSKVVASVLAVGKAYTFIAESVAKVQVAMAATAGEATTLSTVMDVAFGPIGIAIAAAATALIAFNIAINSGNASTAQMDSALQSTTGSFSALIGTFTQGAPQINATINTAVFGGKSLSSQFKDLNGSLDNSARSMGNFLNTTLGNTANSIAFNKVLASIGQRLGTMSSTDLPGAQQGFDQLAKKTDGTSTHLQELLNRMQPYKAAIDQMLTANGQATTSQNEIALATGASTDKVKAVTDAIKAATGAQATFSADLNQSLGGIGTAAITKLTTAYTKSLAPLTDFNTAIQSVQTSQAAALGSSATAAQTTAAQAVSLGALTKQYQENATQAQIWGANLIVVAQKYGQGAANTFIAAGYSATNQSILAQLAAAAAPQGAAYLAAQSKAIDAAGANAAQTLISAGNLVQKNGAPIGAKLASEISSALEIGFTPSEIVDKFNLAFGNVQTVAASKKIPINFDPVLDQASVAAMNAKLALQGGPLGGSKLTVTPTLNQKGVDAMNAELGRDKGVIPVIPSLDPNGVSRMEDTIKKQQSKTVVPTLDQKAVTKMNEALAEKRSVPIDPEVINVHEFTSALNALVAPRTLKVTVNQVTGSLVTSGGGHYAGGYIQGNGRAGYAGGGYTGFGGKYQPAGTVHKGEFVFTKEATDSWGVRNLYRMMNMSRTAAQAPHRGYASGGSVTGAASSANGVTIDLAAFLGTNLQVSLSSYDRQLLQAVGNPQLIISNRDIASASGQQAVVASTRRAG